MLITEFDLIKSVHRTVKLITLFGLADEQVNCKLQQSQKYHKFQLHDEVATSAENERNDIFQLNFDQFSLIASLWIMSLKFFLVFIQFFSFFALPLISLASMAITKQHRVIDFFLSLRHWRRRQTIDIIVKLLCHVCRMQYRSRRAHTDTGTSVQAHPLWTVASETF